MKTKWFVRSCIAAAVCLGGQTPHLMAQGAKAQPSASASATEDESVVVVALAPMSTMLPNVQHLARLVAGGAGAGTVASILKNYTAGLDDTRPAGIFVDLDESGQPSPIACLPLKDLEQFFGQLALIGEPEDLGDGLYQLQVAGNIYFRKTSDWLVVGQSEDAVLNFETGVTNSLKGMVSKHDIRIQVSPQNIPDELVDFFMGQMEAGIQQGMANNPDMDDEQAAVAEANAEQMMKSIEEGIEGTENFVIGLSVNKAEKKTTIDVGTKFVADSKFAKQIEKMKSSKTSLGGVPQDGSMLSMQSLQLVAPEDLAQIKSTMDASVKAAIKQIEEKSSDEASAKKAKEFIEGVVALFLDSAKSGQLESAINVTTDKSLNISASVGVSDGKKVEALAAEAAKAIAAEKVPVEFKVNSGKHGGANLHKVSFPLPPEADEVARKIFGDNVTIAIATAPKAVHIAIGKDCDSVIKATVDRVGAKPSSPGELVKARFSLGQLLQFVQSVESNPAVDAMLEVAGSGNDKIMIDSQTVDRGSVVRVTLEDNVLKSISAGVSNARSGGGF